MVKYAKACPPCLCLFISSFLLLYLSLYLSFLPLSLLSLFSVSCLWPQVEHTRDVISEVEAVSGLYDGLAVSCSQLYFALETLKDVHFLYHFSLRFFQDILAQVLTCRGKCNNTWQTQG